MEPTVSPSTSPSTNVDTQQQQHPRPSVAPPPQTPGSSVVQAPSSATADLTSTSRMGIGQLWNSRGAASYHGSSYFGHQSAASMMQMESPEYVCRFIIAVPVADTIVACRQE